MAAKVLHIVSFDNPFPPDYGGAIDVFYKIAALHRAGVLIHLHLFIDQRLELEGLEPLCETIEIYPKRKRLWSILGKKPLAVAFRESGQLIENLQRINAPILFEGLQTTACLLDGNFKDRKILLRAHNIESDYYKGLAASATGLPRQLLMRYEGLRMKNYEKTILKQVDVVFALSNYEFDYFKERTDPQKVLYVPVFQGNNQVAELSEFGTFALYHGDLSIIDNLRVAKALIQVFKYIEYPLVIAGSKGLEKIMKITMAHDHIRTIQIDDVQKLKELFAAAHINICWSFQRSGTKLKVVHALYQGRYCIINENVIDEERVIALCVQVTDFEQLRKSILKLKGLPYQDYVRRNPTLNHVFDTAKNVEEILKSI